MFRNTRPLVLLSFLLTQLIACTDNYKEHLHFSLDKGWKFTPTDNLGYARPTYNDSDWSSIEVSSPWQKQGYDYVGFGWYRIKILIPSSIKSENKNDSLKISLGKIADSHQLFLNGSIVGENGLMVAPNYKIDSSFVDKPINSGNNEYVISAGDTRIQWDKENILAVRVFNKRYDGGFNSAGPYIGIVSLDDYIDYGDTFYKPDSTGTLDTNLLMKNNFNKPIEGDLHINGRIPEDRESVLDLKVPVFLKPGESQSIPVSLPVTTKPINVSLKFREHLFRESFSDSLIVPYVLVK